MDRAGTRDNFYELQMQLEKLIIETDMSIEAAIQWISHLKNTERESEIKMMLYSWIRGFKFGREYDLELLRISNFCMEIGCSGVSSENCPGNPKCKIVQLVFKKRRCV